MTLNNIIFNNIMLNNVCLLHGYDIVQISYKES